MLSDSIAAVGAVGVVLLAGRGRSPAARLDRRDVRLIVAAGLTQGVATVLLVMALHLPGLAIVSALSALYPVTTVGLAVVVLRERIRPRHAVGLAVAIAGVAGLALARGRRPHRARCRRPESTSGVRSAITRGARRRRRTGRPLRPCPD
jgi:drug/metabolite transporter (DMT)-like permease